MTAVDSDTARYADQDLYALLQVTPSADPRLIQYGYRVAALQNHPDTGGSPERMQLLNKAKEILLDPQRRATYDTLRGHRAGRRPGANAKTARDQRARIAQLERDVTERDRRLSVLGRDLAQRDRRLGVLEQQNQELAAARARLEPTDKEHRVVIGRLREVTAGLGAEGSIAARRLASAVDGLRAPGGASVDPLDPFREVVVMADQPRPRTPRRLVALVAAAALVLGGVGATALPAGAHVLGLRSLPDVAGVVVSYAQAGADTEWASRQVALNEAWGSWPAAIALLHDFLRRWPGYDAAQQKLYAARLAYADSLSRNGQTQEALDQLELAHQLPVELDQGVAFAALRLLVERVTQASSE